jgi:hypothetical protein
VNAQDVSLYAVRRTFFTQDEIGTGFDCGMWKLDKARKHRRLCPGPKQPLKLLWINDAR